MVMSPLGFEVGASDSDNMRTFKLMNAETGVVTYEAVVVWFEVLSKISECEGLAVRAGEYAPRLVVEFGSLVK